MTQFKTSDDLQEHYWSVIVPMCRKYNSEHGADIKPWECVKLDGRAMIATPRFEYKPEQHTFAITILEDRPLFAGDDIWHLVSGAKHDWTFGWTKDFLQWTWTPPPKKRTFMLELDANELTALYGLFQLHCKTWGAWDEMKSMRAKMDAAKDLTEAINKE